MRFKVGDKVRVVKYGHPIFYNKNEYHKMQKYFHDEPTLIELILDVEYKSTPYIKTPPKNLISEDEYSYTVDMSPYLVGQVGVVVGYSDIDGSYSLSGISGKTAWYNEEQLELV